jgi:hypothetical protein
LLSVCISASVVTFHLSRFAARFNPARAVQQFCHSR